MTETLSVGVKTEVIRSLLTLFPLGLILGSLWCTLFRHQIAQSHHTCGLRVLRESVCPLAVTVGPILQHSILKSGGGGGKVRCPVRALGFETNRYGMRNSSHGCNPNGPMMWEGKARPGAGEGSRNDPGRPRD